MNIKTQDKLFHIAQVVFGAAMYGLSMFLAFAFCRIGELCYRTGGIYMVGAALFIVAYFLPVLFAGFFERKYLVGNDGPRAWMFVVCAVAVFLFGLYAALINNGLIQGRDITAELFLWLVMLAVPIVYAVRSFRCKP